MSSNFNIICSIACKNQVVFFTLLSPGCESCDRQMTGHWLYFYNSPQGVRGVGRATTQ